MKILWKLAYIVDDKEITEWLVADTIGRVWRYYKEHIEQDNIEFIGLSKAVPVAILE